MNRERFINLGNQRQVITAQALVAVANGCGRHTMNNILEQDHLYVKKRVIANHGFRSVDGALNTIAGCEAKNIILKGQIRWLPKTDLGGQVRFVQRISGIAALPFTHSRPRSALKKGRLPRLRQNRMQSHRYGFSSFKVVGDHVMNRLHSG